MKNFYRYVCMLICAVIPLTSIVACNKTASDVSGASSAKTSEVTGTSAGTEASPNIPDTDMGGKTFTILTENWYSYKPLDINDITAEELNGESMNDAVYNRYKRIEEKYNCVIANAPFNTIEEGLTALNKTITAGEDVYSLALVRASQYNTLLTSGLLVDLDSVPHIDLNAAWYDTNSLAALSILNRHFGIVSNITMNSYLLIFCAYFNKNMMADYGLGNMYQTVRDGKWTLDLMYKYGKQVAADLNNDGQYTTDDRYGFTYIVDVPEGLLNAGGVRYATLDSKGVPQITYNKEEAVTKMQHLLNILLDTSTTFNVHKRSTQSTVDEVGMFIKGQTLFSIAGIYYAPQFRGMEDDFGIIPLPKYDESQNNYSSPLFCNPFPITTVPISNTDLENTGIIAEAMTYDGYKELLPALYDTLLQGKITRDDDSNKMLDIIFSGTFYDSGLLFNFGSVRDKVRDLYINLNDGFASTFASIDGNVQENIDKLMKKMNDIK